MNRTWLLRRASELQFKGKRTMEDPGQDGLAKVLEGIKKRSKIWKK
jgi:hypothetical protein